MPLRESSLPKDRFRLFMKCAERTNYLGRVLSLTERQTIRKLSMGLKGHPILQD